MSVHLELTCSKCHLLRHNLTLKSIYFHKIPRLFFIIAKHCIVTPKCFLIVELIIEFCVEDTAEVFF